MLAQILLAVFIAATLVQLAAWIGIFARLALYRPTQNSKLKIQNPKLSVLICARNEAENLRKNLPAVLEQQYPDFEVLVVDDDSTDDTPDVLRFFQEKYARLRVLRISPKTTPGKKHALAQGIAAARHEHLVFTDADCRPASPEWLKVLSVGFRVLRHSTLKIQNSKFKIQNSKPEILLGYAPYRPEPGFLNRWIRFETVYTAMQYFSFALMGQPYMGVGRNLAWHKSLFRRVGGFDPHSDLPSGDDDLLVNAAAHAGNTVICLNSKAFVFSEAEKTWRDLWRQKRRHLSAGVRYRALHRAMLGVLALSHVLHYFLLTPLCFSGFGTICVSLWSIRMAPAFLIYWKILRQFREEQLLIWFPLFDALLAYYYAVVVPPVLIRSNSLISWK